MQVPAWVFVILTVFSSVLTIVGCSCLFLLIRHRIKYRRYEKIRSSVKSKKYVPGKTAAYFNEQAVDTVIPLTYPMTLQKGSPMVFPSFNSKSQYYTKQTSGSFVSPRMPATKYSGTSPMPGLNRCASLDDQLFRKTFAIKNTNESKRSREIPLFQKPHDSRNSFRGEFDTDVSVQSESKYEGYQSPPNATRISNADTYYSHSDLLSDDDSLNPSACTADENVVSYDQETDYNISRSKQPDPAFLTFELEYRSSVPELVVTIKHAFDLRPVVDVTSDTVNSYINFCLVPEDFLWKRTHVIENENDPIYDETFCIRDVLHHKLREYTLCFYVMDSHPLLGERPIGKVLYPLSELRAEKSVDVCQELIPP